MISKHALLFLLLATLVIISGCGKSSIDGGTPPRKSVPAASSVTQADSSCEGISDVNQKNACILQLVGRTQDPKLCDGLSSLPAKDGCLLGVAAVKKDVLLCDKIQNPTLKGSCLQTIEQLKSY